MMYSFYHRGDTEVIDEPFYAHYLNEASRVHPGQKEVLESMSINVEGIVASFDTSASTKQHLFIKDMAHHLIDLDISFLKDHFLIFLIRDPKQLIASFAEVIPNPEMKDIGLLRQFEIYQWCLNEKIPHVIIDSGDLLSNVGIYLKELCKNLNIEFKEGMISWPPGPIPADGVWAKYWYKNIHQSQGFSKQQTSNRPLPESCRDLYEESKTFYDQMRSAPQKI